MTDLEIGYYRVGAQPVVGLLHKGELIQVWQPVPEFGFQRVDALIADKAGFVPIPRHEFEAFCRERDLDPDIRFTVAGLTEPHVQPNGRMGVTPLFSMASIGASVARRVLPLFFRPRQTAGVIPASRYDR